MSVPSLFVGSSSESIEIARAIGDRLTDVAEVTVWDEGVFEPSQPFITSLVKALDRFDFAVLVLTPEDRVFVRDTENLQPRDNLMFELGLFMGRLGPARTFMLCPSGTSIKLPSDLAGVTYLKFEADRSDNNLPAAVRPAAQSIRKAIADLGFSETRGIQRLTKATDEVQHKVHDSLTLLLRSRIWETQVFRKHFGSALDASEKQQLDEDLAKLRQAIEDNTG